MWLSLVLALVPSWPQASDATDAVERAIERHRSSPGPVLVDELAALGAPACEPMHRLVDARSTDFPILQVTRALGRIGSRRSIPVLARLLEDDAEATRLIAIEALRDLGFPECLPPLIGALDQESVKVARAAESALLALKLPAGRVVDALSDFVSRAAERSRITCLIARIGGREAHDALLEMATSHDSATVVAAIQGLGILDRAEDGEWIARVLRQTTSGAVRKQACVFLGRVRHAPATRDLIDLLHDTEPGIAANAHWALCRITRQGMRADPELWEFWWKRTLARRRGDASVGDGAFPL